MDLRLKMSRVEELTSWNSNWKGLRVAVFGLGVSGFSVADTLVELGAEVRVWAEKAAPEYLDLLEVLGVTSVVGVNPSKEAFDEFDPELVVTSPGLRPNSELIGWATERRVEIWIDVDLAWRLRDKLGKVADWICVTGTNGKTTTVQLTEQILNTAGLRAAACGNIGTPVLDCIRDENGFDVLVVELSSFQLHYLGEIAPFASALLNLDLDHLDWHGDFEAYRAAKGKIFRNTEAACVYNVKDKATQELVEQADVMEGARAIGFGLGFPGPSNFGYVEDILIDNAYSPMRKQKTLESLASSDDISKIGVVTKHLLENIAAAAALTRAYGVSPGAVAEALASFRLDGHRIEMVALSEEIAWIDDSKATNAHAAEASLSSFDSVVWLVGGLLKGVDISHLVSRVSSRVKAAIVIGVDRSDVVAAFTKNAPNVPLVEIADGDDIMTRAVAAAAGFASAGDTVLLAPAAASMDQFKDYADRGAEFAAAVLNLVGDPNGQT